MWPFLQTTNTSCGCEQSGTNQCGCDKISSLDVSYNGPALACSGINLCDSLTVALQKIEAKICTAGNISGSGINNYVARWHPDGTTLTTGLIRDDGSTIGVNTAPATNSLFKVVGAFDNLISSNNTKNGAFGSVTGNSNGTGALANYGAFFTASNSSTLNVGTFSSAIDVIAGENIGLVASANNSLTNNYAVQLQDPSAGVGKFLKSVTYDGKASWANITTADITGFPSNVVGGLGINDYVARWTPSGTQLGTGLIRDDNTSIGIKTSPNSDRLINAASSTHRFGNFVEVSPTVTTPGQNTIAISGIAQGTNSGADNYGVSGYARGSTSENVGVLGGAIENTVAKNVGGSFIATNSSVLNTAVAGTAISIVAGINIGGTFEATGSTTANYAVQLKDGTEAVDKALTSVTSDGKANWNKISSSYTTGATGSFTSQDGKTITVTNGLITSII